MSVFKLIKFGKVLSFTHTIKRLTMEHVYKRVTDLCDSRTTDTNYLYAMAVAECHAWVVAIDSLKFYMGHVLQLDGKKLVSCI